MKTHRNQSKLNLFLLSSALFLVACNEAPPTEEERAVGTARATIREIPRKYLQCYALTSEEKQACINQIHAEYPDTPRAKSKEYILAYQYEVEKLGFKYFLNDLGLKCESIEEGPLFIEEKQAYLVICKPRRQYYMRFNHASKEWQLIIKESHYDK